jgi:hypothetical protein
MEHLGLAVVRTYSLGLLARAPPPGGAMMGGLGSWGRIGTGCFPSHSFTRSLGTPYVGHLHRLSVNRGRKAFSADKVK